MSRHKHDPKQDSKHTRRATDDQLASETERDDETVRDFDADRNDVRASANTEDGAHHGAGFATRYDDVNYDDYDRDDDARFDSDDSSTRGNSDGSDYGYRRSYGMAEGMSQDEESDASKKRRTRKLDEGEAGPDAGDVR